MNARALVSTVSNDPDALSPGADVQAPVDVVAYSRPLRRVLLVDDQAHVLRVMRGSLDRNGYEVETALNTEVALRLLQETHCDAIIIGMDLPMSTARHLCETVCQQFPDRVPFCLVATDLPHNAPELAWVELLPETELLPAPLSLRWVVARLSQYFGTF